MGGDEEVYSNIRQILGHIIGQTVVDITQHDKDEFEENGRAYVMLMFDKGDYIRFYIGDDAFDHSGPEDS